MEPSDKDWLGEGGDLIYPFLRSLFFNSVFQVTNILTSSIESYNFEDKSADEKAGHGNIFSAIADVATR